MLLQQRAQDKYHSGGLWTITCCSHPLPGDVTPAASAPPPGGRNGSLVRQAGRNFQLYLPGRFDNGLTGYEFDHVLVGTGMSGVIAPDRAEVQAHQQLPLDRIRAAA